jgi:hypothetical protein
MLRPGNARSFGRGNKSICRSHGAESFDPKWIEKFPQLYICLVAERDGAQDVTETTRQRVRHQRFWDNGPDKLREGAAHHIGAVRRRAAGAASGGW